jgi:hypothetical protein
MFFSLICGLFKNISWLDITLFFYCNREREATDSALTVVFFPAARDIFQFSGILILNVASDL